jgi:hypothetical protein
MPEVVRFGGGADGEGPREEGRKREGTLYLGEADRSSGRAGGWVALDSDIFWEICSGFFLMAPCSCGDGLR